MELETLLQKQVTAEEPKHALSESTYQIVPSILLMQLARQDSNGKPILKHLDIVVYALLKAYSRKKAYCWPSYEKLAVNAHCSPSTIQRSLKRLDTAGHIQRKTKGNKGRIYILTDVTGKGVEKRPRVVESPTNKVNPFLSAPEIMRSISIYHPSLEENTFESEKVTDTPIEQEPVPVTYELMTEEVEEDVPF